MPADRDPFDGLRLDEGFVKAARFIEPSATERRSGGDAKRGAPCQVSPVYRGLPGFFHRLVAPPKPAQRRWRATRLVASMALVVGLVSLAVVLLRQNVAKGQSTAQPGNVVAGPTVEVTNSTGTTTPAVGSAETSGVNASSGPGAGVGTSLDTGPDTGAGTGLATATAERLTAPSVTVPGALVPILAPGTCLTWTSPGAAMVAGLGAVDCADPHRAEVTAVVDVGGRFPTWPGRGALDGVVAQSCSAALADYVNTDPAGLLPRPGAAYPAQADWDGPSRVVACLVTDELTGAWTGSTHVSDSVT